MKKGEVGVKLETYSRKKRVGTKRENRREGMRGAKSDLYIMRGKKKKKKEEKRERKDISWLLLLLPLCAGHLNESHI